MNSLNFLSKVWPLEVRRSRSPHATLWHELFRFSGRETSEILFRQTPADPDYRQSFLSAITLADDMVTAWEDVQDDFIGAILLYYGALWLGNAIAFATLNTDQLKQRQAAHGLNVTFDFKKAYPLLEATIDPGNDFQAFGMINAAFGGAKLAGRTFQVKDFITALPEMRHSLPHVHLNSRAIEARWVADPGDDTSDYIARAFPNIEVDLFTEQTPTRAWVRDNLAIGAYLETRDVTADLQIPQRISWERAKHGDERRSPEDELLATTIEHDGRRFFLPTVKRHVVSEYALYLGVLFAIGVAARYNPDYWVNMQRDRSPEFFLIREFLDVAEDKVPMLVLNHLQHQTLTFYSL